MTNENNNTQTQEQENTQTNDYALTTVQRETDDYQILVDSEGKFSRKAKFRDYSSFEVSSRADKIWLLNVLEGDEENGNGLKDHVGKEIEVENIITRTYDKVDEDTGELQYGVLTYLITPKKEVFVTSSKTVYFSINRIMEFIGKPTDSDWENIKVKVKKEKGQNGDIIKIKMVG